MPFVEPWTEAVWTVPLMVRMQAALLTAAKAIYNRAFWDAEGAEARLKKILEVDPVKPEPLGTVGWT